MNGRNSHSDGNLLPLTQNQLLLWTGQRLAPQDPLYNMVLAFHICGPVDSNFFKAAFTELVRQCDALRIVFESRDEVPRQRFLEHLDFDLPVIDFSGEPDSVAARQQWIDTQCKHRFALDGPLFQSALLKSGDNDFIWYLNQHHLITDAWSVAVIYRKMSELYGAASGAGNAEVDNLPLFQDHVISSRQREGTPRQAKARAYWKERLSEPPIPSTFYRKPPADRSGRTERVPVDFGIDRTNRMKKLAGDERFRAFTPDLALFQLFATILFSYLYRISGNDRLAIGVPSHGRPSALSKETAGLFIEVFPLLTEVDDDDTFLSLYKKIATRTQELLIYAEPGVSDFEHSRAFDVVLNYITASFGDFSGMPMQSEWVHPDHGDRNHLLRLQVHDFDQAGELGLYVDLNIDAFVGEEKQRVSEHLLCLVDALLTEPEQAIGAVPLVAGDAEKWLVETLNATPGESPVAESVIEMFEAQAAATPDSVALACRGQSVTYGQLATAIANLASCLASRGAGPEICIAIAMTRSIEAVMAAMAVMKSGASFVPTDPEYPAERIRWILDDTAAPLVLTQAAVRATLPDCAAEVIDIESWLEAADEDPAIGTQPRVALGDPAYVIYTSGSTGKPNGVVVHHKGLANYIGWCRKYYLQGASLDFPLFSSMSFDLTITSLLLPLVSGGRLVIYDDENSDQEYTIRRVVEDNAVDAVKLTPAHLSLIHAMDFSFSRLKKIIVGGEDFKTDLAATISRYFDDQIEIYNEYGPTEGTVACMIHRYDPASDTGGSVPIGRSIDNVQVYILDRNLQVVPQGVVGEICIGGVGVATGYLNQPAKTSECFVENPFVPGEKMYKTGDLARWNSDGVMEYLGRDDHQIKIRGVRIETAEIEAALLEHSGISECVADAVLRQVADPATTGSAFCTECGLDATHPTAQLSDAGVCRTCLVYRHERDAAQAYFRSLDDLRALVPLIKASATGEHDCMMLLSGGKDSTYALAQLVDLGLNPLVFTLDNGYISDGAKQNIQRIVDHLGLDLVTGTTPAMNEIFADSLKRYSNVCEGCFKTIYTLCTKLAVERGISYIVTGLSRGQILETRVADLFHQRIFDPEQIDNTIIEARKAYHRMDDAVSRNIDCSLFRQDDVFQKVHYLDFYRYCDVKLDEVMKYLKTRVAWVRPKDTGRSTNCLINDVGIYVHKRERGYHNYASPYSWDVRVGHKERDAARDELNDRINVDNVHRILREIGYEPEEPLQQQAHKYLVAWYVAEHEIPDDELRAQIAELLPADFMPRQFVRLDSLPLTHNGKVDRRALPQPGLVRPGSVGEYVEPVGAVENQLARLWTEILGVERIGAHDSFFDLGGDSILNIQIVARAKQQGLAITPQNIFDFPTIRELAGVVGEQVAGTATQGLVTGAVPLTPVQQRFFESAEQTQPGNLSQAVLLSVSGDLDEHRLVRAWYEVIKHHDALRARFSRDGDAWKQVISAPDAAQLEFARHDLTGLDASEVDEAIDAIGADLNRSISLDRGILVQVAQLDFGPARSPQVLVVIHHLVVDAVSWWVLLQDLDSAYGQLSSGRDVALPSKTSSVAQWATALSAYAASPRLQNSMNYWQDGGVAHPMPLDFAGGRNVRESARTVLVELDRASTARLVHEIPAAFRVQVPEVLLAAIRRSATWTSTAPLRIDMEGHGREEIAPDIDLLRTVGWFTSIYPVDLSGDPGDTPRNVLAEVKERLRGVPMRGLDYGVLRYLHPDSVLRAQLDRQRRAEILFNYLGQWNPTIASSSRFSFARPIMALHDKSTLRDYVIEINAMVFDGVLRIELTYSENLHRRETIEDFANAVYGELSKLLDAGVDDDAAVLTPSDFPTAGLDQTELDSLLEEFGKRD